MSLRTSYWTARNHLPVAETLVVYIWKINSEGLVPDARQIADGASAILILAVLIFNIGARYTGRLLSAKFTGKGHNK